MGTRTTVAIVSFAFILTLGKCDMLSGRDEVLVITTETPSPNDLSENEQVQPWDYNLPSHVHLLNEAYLEQKRKQRQRSEVRNRCKHFSYMR